MKVQLKGKVIYIGTATVILGAILGGSILLATNTNDKQDSQTPQSNQPSDQTSSTTPSISGIASVPLDHASDTAISLTGLLRKAPSGQYILMSQNPEPNQPAGIAVDTETNKIDVSAYLNDNPVTLTGKMIKTETQDSLTIMFVVSSAKP